MDETPNQQLKRLTAKRPTGKGSKRGNTHIKVDGINYDSKAEYRYRGILDLEVKAGLILGYDYHVKLPLVAEGGRLVGYYEIDYLVHMPDGSQQYRDVKGQVDYIFQWKARHVKAQYGCEVVLIDPKTFRVKKK